MDRVFFCPDRGDHRAALYSEREDQPAPAIRFMGACLAAAAHPVQHWKQRDQYYERAAGQRSRNHTPGWDTGRRIQLREYRSRAARLRRTGHAIHRQCAVRTGRCVQRRRHGWERQGHRLGRYRKDDLVHWHRSGGALAADIQPAPRREAQKIPSGAGSGRLPIARVFVQCRGYALLVWDFPSVHLCNA